MAIQSEVWVADYAEVLNSDAGFLKTFKDMSAFADKKYIHLPQAGATGAVMVDNTTFPLTAVSRVDTVKDIQVRQYALGAIQIPEIETFQVEADKRKSIMGQEYRKIVEAMGDAALASILPSTGRRTALTGAISYADVLALGKKLDMDKVSKNGRYLALPTSMFYDLLADETVARQYANGFNYSVVESGNVLKIAGFMVWERPLVAQVGGKDTAIAYQTDSVCFSKRDPEFFLNERDALYLGDVVSVTAWQGSGLTRSDEAGVVALVSA